MVHRSALPGLPNVPEKYVPWLPTRSNISGFEIIGPPEFAMRNSRFRIHVAPPPGAERLEYRLGVMFQARYPLLGDTSEWRYDDPWTQERMFEYRAFRGGTISFHLQARSSDTNVTVIDAWIGQTTIYEPTEIAALTYLPAAHLAICHAPESGLEDLALARDWRDIETIGGLVEFLKAQRHDVIEAWARQAGFPHAAGLLMATSFASNIWAYGNEDERIEVAAASGKPHISLKDALAAPAANCAEFAALLAMLIEGLGEAKCRSAIINGHVMVQADTDQGPWLLCPTTGFAAACGLEQLISGDVESGVAVILLANRGMQRESPHWRANLVAFRNYLITGLASRCFTPFEVRRDWRSSLRLAAMLEASEGRGSPAA